MKQVIQKISFTLLMSAVLVPASLLAQDTKAKAEKDGKDARSTEQIIITRKGDKDEKVVIEVNGDKITVNGKDIKDAADVTVRRNTIRSSNGSNYSYNYGNNFNSIVFDENRAMLGVTTEKVDNGAEVQEVTKGSAAEKIGLKKGDVITKIDDKKIDSPDDLSAAVRKHKVGEKVNVTYLRDKKETKETAELTKWKGVSVYNTSGGGDFDLDLGDLNMNLGRIRVPSSPRLNNNFGQNWSWSGSGSPKLGMSVQDAEDGKGVKVLEVDDDGNAFKSGIKENDVITEIDGKPVNSADEVAKIVRDSREKASIGVKLQRNGKAESLDLKIPRRLKTADL